MTWLPTWTRFGGKSQNNTLSSQDAAAGNTTDKKAKRKKPTKPQVAADIELAPVSRPSSPQGPFSRSSSPLPLSSSGSPSSTAPSSPSPTASPAPQAARSRGTRETTPVRPPSASLDYSAVFFS